MIINNQSDIKLIHDSIRVIDDWPEKGVTFRDITTLLQNPKAFHAVNAILLNRYKDKKIDAVAGLDARGFIFGPVLAYELGVSFVPIRKKGKLPHKTYAESYTLEYGDKSTVEVHIDAVMANQNVVIIDDLIATGGTMLAACKLIKRLGANVYECAVINDLLYLNGSKMISGAGFPVYSILEYN
jgi:adenine phosphoribosyltransferase